MVSEMKILVIPEIGLEDRDEGIENFSRLDTSEENIKEYKKQYSNLSHVKVGTQFKGVILVDERKFVAVLQCDTKTGYIVALEISPEYRHRGIATELLNLAQHKFSSYKLTVRKTNKEAVALYEKNGYRTFKEEGIMLFMEKKK